jgi:hypothetical protein
MWQKGMTNNKTLYYIYVLIDPDSGKCRYVGKSYDPLFRLNKHIRKKIDPKTHKERWINTLLDANKLPILKTIDCVVGDDWIRAERWWIRFFRKKRQPLTNETDGGDGFLGLSKEAKNKIYTACRSKKLSDAQTNWLKTHKHPCLGRKVSDKQVSEHKAFLVEYYKDPANHKYGRECSNDTKLKISNIQKERFKKGILFHCQHCPYITTNFGSLGAHVIKCKNVDLKRGGEITKDCALCGISFVSFKCSKRRFCSAECYHKSRKIKV